MARVKKPACREVKIWGWHLCRECENRPWPKCGNIEKWHTPTLKEWLIGWPKNKTKAERIEIQEKLKTSYRYRHAGEKGRKKMLDFSWELSKPVTKKDKIESYRDFINLPDYIPLPTGDETMAIFIGKKNEC